MLLSLRQHRLRDDPEHSDEKDQDDSVEFSYLRQSLFLFAGLTVVLLTGVGGLICAEASRNNYALAEKLYRSGKLSEAEPLYLQVGPGSPEFPVAQLRLGTIYYLTSRPALAETSFETYLKCRQSPEVYCLLAGAQFNQKKYETAARSARKALSLDPTFAKAYTVLGMIHTAENEWPQADADYHKALKLNRNDTDAWFMLGQALYLRNNFPAAARSFQEALRIDPRSGRSYGALARARNAMGDIAGAEDSFKKGISAGGEAVGLRKAIYSQYADFLLKLGRLKDSQAEAEGGLKIAPRDPELHYELGKILFREGRLAEAAAQEQTALRLGGKNYRVDFLLAQVYTAMRNSKEASRYAALAAQAAPQGSR